MREKLVMDKPGDYVTVNIFLTVGNGANMSGLAAVSHAQRLQQRPVPSKPPYDLLNFFPFLPSTERVG